MNRINGTIDDDTLQGSPGPDEIFGMEGNDHIIAGEGDDWLYGGIGNDLMDGGPGNDRYFVDSALDVVIEAAGGGFDQIETTVDYVLAPGSEVELVFSAPGTAPVILTGNELGNHLYGNAGANYLIGGDGGNILEGFAGNDTLDGGSDIDALFGGAGDDVLYGGAGSDALEGGDGDDLLDGGAGIDRASYAEASAAVTVDLRISTQNTGGAGTDTLLGLEDVWGSNYADLLVGTDSANTLTGWGGNDVIYARAGDDRLYGYDGDDTLFPGLGTDQITVGAGADTIEGSSAELNGDIVFDFSRGDRIIVTDASIGEFKMMLNGATLAFPGNSLQLESLQLASLTVNAVVGGGVEISFGGPPLVIGAGPSVALGFI